MISRSRLEQFIEEYESDYRKRTTKSHFLTSKAKSWMPGGEARAGTWFSPYPLWIDAARGCRVSDVDGNEYVDFHNNYTSMVLGHGDPAIVSAVLEQTAKGTSFGGLTPSVLEWSETISRRLRGDRVRFTTSGTEAVMTAIRLARAFTGKDLIMKMEGGYHGSYDPVVQPSNAAGLPKSVLPDTTVVPFNDVQTVYEKISTRRGELAAVIVEGALGTNGMIPPRPGYLESLRAITAAHEVLLILDEIITFRLDVGGLQRVHQVTPDLTTLGKVIGGGYPVGAVCGRADIMDLVAPEYRTVHHSGTFVAHPVTAVAGIVTLNRLDEATIAQINELGEQLRTGLAKALTKNGISGHITGIGSLQNIHFGIQRPDNARSVNETNKDLLRLFHMCMLKRGVFLAARGLFSVSTAMTDNEIAFTINAAEDTLAELRPLVVATWPTLVA